MNEKFQLPVEYKGEELALNTSLLVTGFTHKFVVEVYEVSRVIGLKVAVCIFAFII